MKRYDMVLDTRLSVGRLHSQAFGSALPKGTPLHRQVAAVYIGPSLG